MKKFLLLLSMAIASVASAQYMDYPVVYDAEIGGPVQNPSYAPAQEQPSYRDSALLLKRYTLDLGVGYAFRAAPSSKFACNMLTVEAEGAYFVLPHHALTFSLGFAGGGKTRNFWVCDGWDDYPFTDSYDRMSLTFMGGYRYSRAFGRYFILQFGGKCGMDVQTLNVDYGYGWHDYDDDDDINRGRRNSGVGMAYAGYVNLGAFVSPNVCIHLGYQYRGSTARPSVSNPFPDEPKFKASSMRWHEVRLGFTAHF